MKKFFALLVSLLMVLGIVAVPALAEGSATMTVDTVDGTPGEQVVVKVSVTGDFAIHGMEVYVNYDAANLSVASVKKGAALKDGPEDILSVLDKNTAGQVKIGVICPTDAYEEEGDLAEITFVVNEACTETQVLALDVADFYSLPVGGEKEEIPCEAVNGAINITPVVEPTDPVEPTEPVVTDEPTEPVVTDEPTEPVVTDKPGDEPAPVNPPQTGAASLIGLSVVAIAAGAGIVIFRKKED